MVLTSNEVSVPIEKWVTMPIYKNGEWVEHKLPDMDDLYRRWKIAAEEYIAQHPELN